MATRRIPTFHTLDDPNNPFPVPEQPPGTSPDLPTSPEGPLPPPPFQGPQQPEGPYITGDEPGGPNDPAGKPGGVTVGKGDKGGDNTAGLETAKALAAFFGAMLNKKHSFWGEKGGIDPRDAFKKSGAYMGSLEGMIGNLGKGINIPDASQAQFPTFTGGGMPMPIGILNPGGFGGARLKSPSGSSSDSSGGYGTPVPTGGVTGPYDETHPKYPAGSKDDVGNTIPEIPEPAPPPPVVQEGTQVQGRTLPPDPSPDAAQNMGQYPNTDAQTTPPYESMMGAQLRAPSTGAAAGNDYEQALAAFKLLGIHPQG